MIAFKLRHRVIIEQKSITRDAYGSAIESWVAFADNVPAEVYPLSGKEFIAAQSVQAGVTARITIRYIIGVVGDMRVRHDGNTYNIKAVLPDKTARHHITLMCETGVNDG